MNVAPMIALAVATLGCDARVDSLRPIDAASSIGDVGTSEDAGDGMDSGGTPITYRSHVAPLLQENCVTCHVAGGIAPFQLDSYQTASTNAPAIASSTAARRMPPWGPTDNGSCQGWKDSRYLAGSEIATFAAWAGQGTLEGDTSIAIPPAPTPPVLIGANARGDMPAPFTVPLTGHAYRCFKLDLVATGALPAPDASGRVLITGFDVTPGNRQIVHHVIVWATTDAPATVDPILAAKAAEDPAPGWDCSGGSGVVTPHDVVAVWAPGTGATNYPAPTGIGVRSDTRLIMQVHYNGAANVTDYGTRISLATSAIATGTKVAGWYSVSNTSLNIPPGQTAHSVTQEATLGQFAGLPANLPGVLYGVYPHMHMLGTEISLVRNTNQCLVSVPGWNFHWQSAYFLAQPVAISTSDSFRISCVYNSTGRATTTTYGEASSDEMCMVLLYAAPP